MCQDAAWPDGLSEPPSRMTGYQKNPGEILTVACVSNASSSNWRWGIDVRKSKQNGLEQSHKCHFPSEPCLPNSHTLPHSVCGEEEKKEHVCFQTLWEKTAQLASWHTKSRTSHTKTSLWSGNYRSSHLTLLSLLHSPPLSASFPRSYWSSDCRLGETGNTRTLQYDS